MANISDTMDSVFDDGLDFDTIFDREDSLIDTVEGVKEEDMDWFDEADAAIVSGDVGHIPGEPDTDNGPGGHEGTGAKELPKTDSEGKEVPSSQEHQAYSDGDCPKGFKKELGYSEGADPDDYLLDDESPQENCKKEGCKESADLDDELLDESYLDPDEYLVDESADEETVDEENVDWFKEEFDVDDDDDLIDAVDGDNSTGSAGLDYEPGSDDEILDDII